MRAPVNNEEIVRTGSWDFLQWGLRAREALLRVTRWGRRSSSSAASGSTMKRTGSIQRLKDTISAVLRYPDFAAGWLFPAILSGGSCIRERNIDAIFATGSPWTALLVGWALKWRYGTCFVADFRDPWVGNPYSDPDPRWRLALDRWWERRIVESADLVTLNTERLREEFVSRYPTIDSARFITLRNGFDAADFEGIDVHRTPKCSTSAKGMLDLVHAGLVYGKRDLRPILEAVALLGGMPQDGGPKVRIFQLGDVEDAEQLNCWLNDRGLNQVLSCVETLPYRECLERMAHADVLVILQQGTVNQVPSKLYEYIFLQKPILAIGETESALGDILRHHKLGEVFAAEDLEGIARFLREAWNRKQTGTTDIDLAESAVEFDVRVIASKLEDHLQKLAQD